MSAPLALALRVLLATALYAFLGWAMWTIWLDLQQTSRKASRSQIPAIHLEVQTRGRSPLSRIFDQPHVEIGRDRACDIVLTDGTVSARHASLRYHHGQWWLHDLGSTNGTKLNRGKLTTPTVLTSGDLIQCGKIRITVTISNEGVLS